VLEKLDDQSVRVFVVWVPMNRGLERDVANATKEVWDPRARHYWDGDGQLIAGYRDVLGGYDEPVWDTFILYGRDAKWEGDRPPTPAYWMHQLGSSRKPRVKGIYWDPAGFLEQAKSLVAKRP